MKECLAWIIFTFATAVCLLWIGFGVRDDLREDDVFHDIIEDRLDHADDPGDEVHIGVAGNFATHEDILLGVKLAAEELNTKDGILGRRIILDVRDDHGTVDDSLAVAQEFSSTPEIGFVIGHTNFGLSESVAQNYEFYGVLRISPNTHGNTRTGFSMLFENGLQPSLTGEAILEIAAENNWRRLGLIYTKNKGAMQQARQFESMANKQNIKVPLAFAFQGRGSGISLHMEKWKRELDLDAIVLAIDQANVTGIISACRAVGIDCPFILVAERASLPQKKSNTLGTIYVMDPPRTDAAFTGLSARFQSTHGIPLTMDALLGYDTLQILAQAISEADSFVPSEVAETLKDIQVKDSMTGTESFDAKGTAVRQPPHFSIF